MLGVVGDAEMAFDDLGDAGGGPQVVVPPVGSGPLEEELLRGRELGVGQRGRMDDGSGVGGGVSPSTRTAWTAALRRRSSSAGLPLVLIPHSTQPIRLRVVILGRDSGELLKLFWSAA